MCPKIDRGTLDDEITSKTNDVGFTPDHRESSKMTFMLRCCEFHSTVSCVL